MICSNPAPTRRRPRASRSATRQSSQATLNAIGPSLPEMLGGSADLTPSNGTLRKDSVILTPAAPAGNYVHFGVREFGMSAILNGVSGARRVHPVRRHVPHLLRLFPQCAAHGGAHAPAGEFRVHARLDRTRRGRPHAPADRAAGDTARDSAHGRMAPLRCGRDGGRLGGRHRQPRRTDLPRLHAPGGDASGASSRASGGHPARRLRARRLRRSARGHRHRYRLGGRHRRRGGARRRGERAQGEAGLDAEHDHLRRPGRGLQGQRAAARR